MMKGRVREATREFVDGAPQRWPNLPMVVLVDEYSASASEIGRRAAGSRSGGRRGSTSYGKEARRRSIRSRAAAHR
jgi:C-terminal processing protease CtpA/Prc